MLINSPIYRKISCAMLLGLSVMPQTSLAAAGSEVSIQAQVVASPCTVSDESLVQEVNLGKPWTSELSSAGGTASWAMFSVKLKSCPPGTSQVVATFSGASDPDYPDYYLNTGSSKNVAIDVTDATGNSELSNGKTLTANVDSQGNASFDLKGRMISPKGKATAGNVAGSLEVTFNYR